MYIFAVTLVLVSTLPMKAEGKCLYEGERNAISKEKALFNSCPWATVFRRHSHDGYVSLVFRSGFGKYNSVDQANAQ